MKPDFNSLTVVRSISPNYFSPLLWLVAVKARDKHRAACKQICTHVEVQIVESDSESVNIESNTSGLTIIIKWSTLTPSTTPRDIERLLSWSRANEGFTWYGQRIRVSGLGRGLFKRINRINVACTIRVTVDIIECGCCAHYRTGPAIDRIAYAG